MSRHGPEATNHVTTLYDVEHIRFAGSHWCMAYLGRGPEA